MNEPHDPNDPLLVACRDLSRQMDLFDDAAARALGIGRNDLRALNLLEHGPLSAATIADRLHLTRAGVTSLIDRLEAENLVARTTEPTDRRVVLVELQPSTWKAFALIYRPLGRQVQAATAHLGPNQRQGLTSALEILTSAFSEARSRVAAEAEAPLASTRR